jgi:hypothetical protein
VDRLLSGLCIINKHEDTKYVKNKKFKKIEIESKKSYSSLQYMLSLHDHNERTVTQNKHIEVSIADV